MTRKKGISNLSVPVNYVFLGVIVLAGFGLRYHHLGGDLFADEVWVNATAVSPFSDFVREIKEDWVHPPLFHFFARAWVYIFGISDVSCRLLSMTFGVLSIPLIYLLGRQVSGSHSGLIASALLALSPTHIFHSQYGRHYSLYVFFVLLSIVAFLKVYSQPVNRKYGFFYCISAILLVYTHYFGWVIVFCQFFFIFGRFRVIKYWAVFPVFIFLAYIPWIIIVLKAAEVTSLMHSLVMGSNNPLVPHIEWLEPPSLLEPIKTLVIFNGEIPFSHQRKLGILLLGGISFLSLKGIFGKGNKDNYLILFFWSCIVVPFVIVFIVSHTVQPIWLARSMLLSLPSYYLLIALGSHQVSNRKISIALMVGPIVWMSMASIHHIRGEHRMPFEKVSEYLSKVPENEGPILVVDSYLINPLILYYKGKGGLYELSDSNISVVPVAQKGVPLQILSSTGGKGGRLIFVTYPSADMGIRAELFSKYRIVKQEDFFGHGEEGQVRGVRIIFYEKIGSIPLKPAPDFVFSN